MSFFGQQQPSDEQQQQAGVPLSFIHAQHGSAGSGLGFAASPFAALTPFPFQHAAAMGSEQPSAFHFQQHHESNPLTSSALDSGVVYRGLHEPTMFAAPLQQQQAVADPWDHHAYAQQTAAVSMKKLEMPSLRMMAAAVPHAQAPNTTFVPLVTSSSSLPSLAGLELPCAPSHVERFTSFYTGASPAAISKALRIAFQTLSDMRVEVTEDSHKAKFRGVCWTERGDSIPFVARVYRAQSGAPAPFLVEVQRRCGDCASFFRLYQKLVKSCGALVAAAFDSSCQLPSAVHSFAPLPLPSLLPSPGLELPSLRSLCSMAEVPQVDCRREASRCLFQMASQGELFPVAASLQSASPMPPAMPSLSRASSTLSTASSVAVEEASAALWTALVGLLRSSDGECARLGAAILRACLKRKQAARLLDHLEADLMLLQLLTNKVAEEGDANDHSADAAAQREFQREIRAVLAALEARREGRAF